LLNIIAGNAFSKVDVKAAVYISTPTLLYRGGNFCFASKPWHKQIGFDMDGQSMDVFLDIE